jgi:hypothetical protein
MGYMERKSAKTSDLPAWPRYVSPMRAAAHSQGMLRAVGNPYGEVRV